MISSFFLPIQQTITSPPHLINNDASALTVTRMFLGVAVVYTVTSVLILLYDTLTTYDSIQFDYDYNTGMALLWLSVSNAA